MRIAFLADIHGNLPALEAVIADLKSQAPDAVFLVGDQINRCPWSNEVMDLVSVTGWQAIQGNHEVIIKRLSSSHESIRFDNRERFPDLWWTLGRLGDRRLAEIGTWPAELLVDLGVGQPIRLIHGIPGDPFRGLFIDMNERDIAPVIQDVGESVIVAGHTHQPLHRSVDGKVVFNGGSIGIPYNGDTRAQYLILTWTGESWSATFRRLDYPVAAVREAFVQHNLFELFGPLAELHLRTVESAQPWTSDFGHWLNQQPSEVQSALKQAVRTYESQHGPGRWSFQQG